jgi:glyoxylase-like metal-dependent hydrolase (beta-lactamase superfamily II)
MRIKGLQVGPIGTNCYIVEDENAKRAAIIDPGADAGAILQAVVKDDPEMEVACILLTHGHYDHTSAIPDLREALPEVPVFIHRADFVDKDKQLFTLPEDLENVHFYDEGDKVKVGDIYIEVALHTPGHSAGSVVLRVEDVLFTGDTLFRGSCGRTDFPDGDYGQILNSLKRIAQLEGEYTVCPGHEGMTSLESERTGNYYILEALRRS